MKQLLLATLLCFSLACSKRVDPTTAQLEKDFEQMMTNCALVGHSTQTKREGISGEERYEISKATKVGAETWLLQSTMKIGGKQWPLPIPVTIKWAGDTPVITLTDMAIPGVGTYTARVVLYRDQYAGTWSGKTAGGQMFGKIIHLPKP